MASSDGMRTYVGSSRPTGPASCPTANAPSPGTALLLAPFLYTAQPSSNQVGQQKSLVVLWRFCLPQIARHNCLVCILTTQPLELTLLLIPQASTSLVNMDGGL